MKAPYTLAVLSALLTGCSGPESPSTPTSSKASAGYWKISSERWIYIPEVRDDDGTLYLSSYQGLQAVNEKTGRARWILESVDRAAERVIRSGSLVLAYAFMANPGALRAIDAKTGKQLWIANGLNSRNKPVATGQIIWMLSNTDELLAIDAATGKSRSVAHYASKDMALNESGGVLLVGQGAAGILEGRKASDGALLWTRKLDDLLLKSWIGADRTTAAVATQSGLYAFNAANGEPLWTHPYHMKEPFRSNFQVLDDRLFYSEANGSIHTLHALDLATGKEQWKAGDFTYLSDEKMVRRVDDLWVVATSADVTTITREGQRLATVSAFTASTAGGESFATQGEFGYAVEAQPPPRKAWENVQGSSRDKSTLIKFRLRTGEVIARFSRKGIYDLAILNGRMLMVTEDGLASINPPEGDSIHW